MKHIATTTACLLLAGTMTVALTGCSACGHGADDFDVKTDSVVLNNATGEFKTVFDTPEDAGTPLAQTVTEWLSETMGGSYDGKYDDMGKVVKFYLDSTYVRDSTDYAQLKADLKKMHSTDMPVWKYAYDAEVRKIADTEGYVTYLYTCYEYQGGAHGSTALMGQTFRKSDGRRIGWLFRDTSFGGFQELLKSGLKRYWKVKTDEDLAGYLLNSNDIYQLPLPQCPPLFTADGVRFIYGQYEIAPYAAGTPDFTIPYKDLSKYMMVTAKALVE